MRIRSTILCSAAFGAIAFGCVPTAVAAQESDGVSEDAEAQDDATIGVVGIRGSVEAANDMKRTSKQLVERSEERRGGKECVSPCRYRWATDHKKKTKLTQYN